MGPEVVAADLDEDAEEDATMGENTRVEATRGGKILGGAHVKSLETAGVSLEQVVLTSEETIKDFSSDSEDKMLEMEGSKEDSSAIELGKVKAMRGSAQRHALPQPRLSWPRFP